MKQININEIEGFRIGSEEDLVGGTGCTAIICEEGATPGGDIRGGGPASRETELLRAEKMVQKIHCVMLSGGSAFGLASCDGAMSYLEERGIGFDVGVTKVPIVVGASLFDLVVGDPKVRPNRNMGYLACVNSEENNPKSGCYGAGTGASVGKYLGPAKMMKSGLGIYAAQVGEVKLGAVVAVNAMGDVFEDGRKIAGIKSELSTKELMLGDLQKGRDVFSGNTTIACLVTNARLSKAQANKLSQVAHNAFARTIEPVHTSVDGDSIFVMANNKVDVSEDCLGVLAVEVLEKAIINSVKFSTPMFGLDAFCGIIK